MKIVAVDQLTVVDDGDSYAASMGVTYPTNGGNAQYYLADGNGKVTEVTPMFADRDGERLVFFPQLFSAKESKYLEADGEIVFRFNNRTSNDAVIARGTMAQYANGTALQSGTWNTAAQGATAQTYAQVFKVGVMTLGSGVNAIQVPTLSIIGQLAYRTKNDITFFCTCKVGDASLTCKGDVEIRSKTADNYKVIVSAVSSAGGNDQVINDAGETITLTASLLHNGTAVPVASGMTFKWYKFTEPTTTLGTQATLQVTEAMVSGTADFVCEVTYDNSVYTGIITINDIQDQYMVEKNRVTKDANNNTVENTNILKTGYYVTYTPSIVDKNTGGTPTNMRGTWTYTFILKNAAGSIVSTTVASTMTVTAATVKTQGGIDVHIVAENSSM